MLKTALRVARKKRPTPGNHIETLLSHVLNGQKAVPEPLSEALHGKGKGRAADLPGFFGAPKLSQSLRGPTCSCSKPLDRKVNETSFRPSTSKTTLELLDSQDQQQRENVQNQTGIKKIRRYLRLLHRKLDHLFVKRPDQVSVPQDSAVFAQLFDGALCDITTTMTSEVAVQILENHFAPLLYELGCLTRTQNPQQPIHPELQLSIRIVCEITNFLASKGSSAFQEASSIIITALQALENIERNDLFLQSLQQAVEQYKSIQAYQNSALSSSLLSIVVNVLPPEYTLLFVTDSFPDDLGQLSWSALVQLSEECIKNPDFCHRLGNSLPIHPLLSLPLTSPPERLSELYSTLHRKLFTELSVEHLHSPPPMHRAKQRAWSFLIGGYTQTIMKILTLKGPILEINGLIVHFFDLLTTAKGMGFYPDRLAISAILYLIIKTLSIQSSEVSQKTKIGIIDWLWKEWTILREYQPVPKEDDAIIVGFLDATRVLCPIFRQGDKRTQLKERDFPVNWAEQVLDMALAEGAIRPSRSGREVPYLTYELPSTDVNAHLIRAIALASLRAGRLDTVLACLYDPRLSPDHRIAVLGELSSFIENCNTLTTQALRSLVEVVVENVRLLSTQPHISKLRTRQLNPTIQLLLKNKYYEEAGSCILSLPHPTWLGYSNLSYYFKQLLQFGPVKTTRSIYIRARDECFSATPLYPLLSDRCESLSDLVWRDLMKREDRRPRPSFLRARLLHHSHRPRKAVGRALAEYIEALDVFGYKEPDLFSQVTIVFLLLKSGNRKLGKRAYDHWKDWPASHKHRLMNIFLSTQNIPHRPHSTRKGPASVMGKFADEYVRLVEKEGLQPDGVTANIMLKSMISWAEVGREEIWAALEFGLQNAGNRDWEKELKPLFRLAVQAFRERGCNADIAKTLQLRAEERRRRKGFNAKEEVQ